MKILVLNSGSSSLKYQILNMPEWVVICEWLVERVWITWSVFTIKINWNKIKVNKDVSNHKEALDFVVEMLLNWETKVLEDINEINAVWHRVLHWWEIYKDSVVINNDVMNNLEKLIPLWPLHMPANMMWIKAINEILPNVSNVAVFDTAFHQTMSAENYIYAIPYEYYEKYWIRRYWFHWTSHKYVTSRVCEIMKKDYNSTRIINCHVWNWASICAIKDWKVMETSMWFTPLEWLVMWTRSWDIDPAIIKFLSDNEWKTAQEIDEILNKKSWILWITQKSSDMREVEDWYIIWDERSVLAMNIYINRIIKYIGSYATLMGGVDVITLTAWVLENSWIMRKLIVDKLWIFWIKLDETKNNFRWEERVITTDDSLVSVLVVPTNEEFVIAQDSYSLLK